MKRMILFSGLVLWTLAAGAEARDWGFSKDTVYEWNPGRDTVYLINNGPDTLWLDSLFAEAVDTTNWIHASFFYHGVSLQYQIGLSQEVTPYFKMLNDGVPPGVTVHLRNFNVAGVLVKRAAFHLFPAEGNVVRVRLRFKSTAAEEDTLLASGVCCGSSITPPVRHPSSSVPTFLNHDILGRVLVPSRNFPVIIKKLPE